jgi:hypothetical protein
VILPANFCRRTVIPATTINGKVCPNQTSPPALRNGTRGERTFDAMIVDDGV